MYLKHRNSFWEGVKTLLKKEKLLVMFSPFLTMFLKGFFYSIVKSWNSVVKGEGLEFQTCQNKNMPLRFAKLKLKLD